MRTEMLKIDTHFLSASNPLATADQRDTERHALALMDAPAFKQLRAGAARRWRELAGKVPKEAEERFETLLDECAFANVVKAVSGDPSRPRVVRIVMPPHDWLGMSVPGSRFGGGPGADQSYAIIPVGYGTHYRIHGRWIGEPPADHNYTLSGNAHFMNSLQTLHHDDITVGDGGTFTLTVGPEGGGGNNHLRTVPGAEYLFIRDCRSDWRQAATALTVEALDAPRTAAWTDEQIMARATQLALDDAPPMFYWVRLYQNMEPNTPMGPALTDGIGGLISQTTSLARVVLGDDEALVITIEPADAAFHDVQLNDYWFNSVGDYYGRTASFNNEQTRLGSDGTATYVVSLADPGVHNWLDPNGLRETLFVARWQRIPRPRGGRRPSLAARLVKLRELNSVLPADMTRVSEQERRAQIESRLATYRLRLAV